MEAYQTFSTVDDSNKVVLSNLPFQAGPKVEIYIKVVDEKRLEAAKNLRDLFKEIQALPSSQELTLEEIAQEIEACRTR